MSNKLWGDALKALVGDNYSVVDIETTGLDTRTAEIIELALYAQRNGKTLQGAFLAQRQGRQGLPAEIITLTGISDAMLEQEGQPLPQILGSLSVLAGAPIVGHNILRYDAPVISRHLKALGMIDVIAESVLIDTAALFKARQLGIRMSAGETFLRYQSRILELRAPGVKYNLPFACATLGIDTAGIQAHRAAGDVEMTRRVFERLKAE